MSKEEKNLKESENRRE